MNLNELLQLSRKQQPNRIGRVRLYIDTYIHTYAHLVKGILVLTEDIFMHTVVLVTVGGTCVYIHT